MIKPHIEDKPKYTYTLAYPEDFVPAGEEEFDDEDWALERLKQDNNNDEGWEYVLLRHDVDADKMWLYEDNKWVFIC